MPTMTAASLFRDVGLLADGPVPWGRPVPAHTPGLFIVELGEPRPTAPIELSLIGKWLERVPGLRLDGKRPTSRALQTRLQSFWLPDQRILYIGASNGSIGGRLAAMEATVLGDRRPASSAHWLKTLRLPPTTRIWWASTTAIEEYEDAVLTAFAEGITAKERAERSGDEVILPWANLRRPTGERRATGLTGALLEEPAAPAPPPTRVTVLPDGDAEGANGEPPERRKRVTPGAGGRARTTTSRAGGRAAASGAASAPVATLTAEGAKRLEAELQELTQVQRPQVIARIRAAKELGDLKENADYTAAREEQSFLEGRVQAIEARLREAVIATVPAAGAGADLGSSVTVEVDGDTMVYRLVGTAEANAAQGRVSIASPVGSALVGAVAGDEVIVTTPRGPVPYRVVNVE